MMATQRLEQDLLSIMPRARRYSRALLGNTHIADANLALAAKKVVKKKPVFGILTPTGMVLPWLIVELHTVVDSNDAIVEDRLDIQSSKYEPTLDDQFDSGLETLSDIQKRVFLLIQLEQFSFSITSALLGISVTNVKAHFQNAHILVNEHIAENYLNC